MLLREDMRYFDHNILVSELQALVQETRRRHPDVKDAGESALESLKSGPLPKPIPLKQADILLSPITLGCKTKTPKIIGISLAALQRLVALSGLPTEHLPVVLQTLTSVSGQGVDIQLKILQTILAVLTFNKDVHDEVLGSALLLCFKLQDSRVSVVSSTAAATLRQAVMVVFDRVSTDESSPSVQLSLPGDPQVDLTLTQSAMDTFSIFSDLCLLTAEKAKPRLLKLSTLSRTFGLELIESILSGYESGVKQRPELLHVVKISLDPLLIKLLADKPPFPVALRLCRILFLLIRSFINHLPIQVESYLSTLIRLGMGDTEHEESKKEHVPPWLRVLALEILRGICGDAALLQDIWIHYDQPGEPGLFAKLISSLGRLVNEKPTLLGIGTKMQGLGVPAVEGHHSNPGYLDMGIGMVASAASVGVSTVSSMIGAQGAGLGPQSAMKLKLIEQHDKVEAPPIPETYIYLLALQSVNAVAEGIFAVSGQTSETPLAITGLAESAWPALLAAQSFCIATNLSDSLFAEVLSALQNFTIACGVLNLRTPRDAFLSTLGKYAVPPQLVSAAQTYLEAPAGSHRNNVMNTDALGLGAALGVGVVPSPPSLSERNLACLKSAITVARLLAASLGPAWHDVLEVVQNANFLLTVKRPNVSRKQPTGTPQIGSTSPSRSRTSGEGQRPEVFEDLEVDVIQLAINALFDSTRELDDAALSTFLSALCQLSSEMIGMDPSHFTVVNPTNGSVSPSVTEGPLSPGLAVSTEMHRRRSSGINISHSIKSGDRSFSLHKLRTVGMLNLSRLVKGDSQIGWTMYTQHLLAVARHLTAPSTIRTQASEALNEFLLSAIRVGRDSRVQHQVFDVLVKQVDVNPISNSIATDYDVRSTGFQTLNNILESSGHSLQVGWDTIFGMLNNVCRDSSSGSGFLHRNDSSTSVNTTFRAPTSSTLSKGDAALVRIAFPSLNLICTDFLSSLNPEDLRLCISCLGCYGRQRDDVNITLAAIGLLWAVSDAVQQRQLIDLWLHLLTELLELGRDPRLEVRSGAMQTLFRCVELYGASLSSELWAEVLNKVILPLLEGAQGDDAHVLALTSVGGIFQSFLSSLLRLDDFERVYERLLGQLQRAFISPPRTCATAALRALERILLGLSSVPPPPTCIDKSWNIYCDMSANIAQGEPYTQENLIALTRVGSLLHVQLPFSDSTSRQLSQILRSFMTYSRSPDYRPDVDSMSPLQSAITELLTSSHGFAPSIVLEDLAEYTSLAYSGDGQGGKLSFVGLSKWTMPTMARIFQACSSDVEAYEDGTVESVLGAYAIPVKLKYDCPSPCKFGEDQPLWRTVSFDVLVRRWADEKAMTAFYIQTERYEGIWSQIMVVFAATLLGDNPNDLPEEDEHFVISILTHIHTSIAAHLGDDRVPDRVLSQYADVLAKASRVHRYDTTSEGGTTAPAVAEPSEQMRYWAFDRLVEAVTRSSTSTSSNAQSVKVQAEENAKRVARLSIPALIGRFESSLRQFLDDSKIRGQMPFPRVREDELMYILRHLVTLRIWEDTISSFSHVSVTLQTAYSTSSRAHLFHFYPLLLELCFFIVPLPSMWIFPSEHAQLMSLTPESSTSRRPSHESRVEPDGSGYDGGETQLSQSRSEVIDAGNGEDLVEINARDIARRCLELVGEEMGLG
ncbi:hypothetical protein M231_02113 [Tremella mesenterica]|uniref:Protein MON2 homolog n=1 Tax=Tremella mesenterica TaxID=5217 RepID=A0A4Q1BRS0_TREME|nr:hypothetical protein M231_02113 [Tremella mesenterica]